MKTLVGNQKYLVLILVTVLIAVGTQSSSGQTITASVDTPLTERTLDESVVTLTLNGATYARSIFDIRGAVEVSGIDGVTIPWHDPDRESDTEITVELEFNGADFDADAILTFTVGADAIANYNGATLTAQVSVTAVTESVVASTVAPLTESTLDESVVTLTLNGANYARSIFDIDDGLTVSGIDGVTYHWFDLDRVSDTVITVGLQFNGNIDSNGTLTFTVGADAIAGYNGDALTATLPVTTTSVQTPEVLVVDPASPPIYWTDAEKIKHVNLDGSNVEDLVTGLDEPIGIALDVSSSKMYWVDFGTQKIQRSNLDGSNVEYIGAGAVSSIALDVTGGKIYWTTRTTASSIRRANLDGSNVEDLVIRGLNAPNGIALDIQGGKMYWTDGGADKIQRANLDGSNVEDIVTGLSTPLGITLDAAKAKMYWTDGGADKIQRANLDGSNVEDLVTGVSDPYGITLDAAKAKMYWTEREAGKIQRANLDGSNVEDIVTGLDRPFGIALGILYQNRAPVFSEGASTTRTVAEDTGAGVNIGSAVSATDADNDTLTYTLSGTDATSFDIVRTSGQLQTKSALDYETKTSYTVTVTVSDGTLTDSITVTITVTDVTEETVTASTRAPLTEATVDESVVTLTLTGGTYEPSIGTIRNNVTVSGIAGVTARSSDVLRVSDTVVTVELTFDGTDFDTAGTLTFTVGAAAVADYTDVALTAQVPVTALEETVTASTPAPLTETTVDESVATLTLSGRVYESRSTVENNVTVSGIDGVTIGTDGIDRESDTAITVQLEFDGDLVADAHLTFTVGAGAIANYNGSALTAILPVTTVEENSITVSLQKVGADQFKAIASSSTPFDIVLPLSVTNGRITGGATTVTIPTGSVESELLTVTRTPGTSDDITVDIGPLPGIPATHPGYSLVKSTDLPLPFITYAETSLMAIRGTITNQDGTPAGAGLQVTVTIGSTTKTATSEVEGAYAVIFLVLQGAVATSEDTVTVEVVNETTGASVEHTGPLSPEQITAKQATIDLQFSTPPQAVSLTASTVAPLTESTLDGSVVTLTLTGGTYESSIVTIRNAVAVSGITGVTVATSDVSRVNDTKVTVELTFNGTDFDTNATLTLTVGAGAIAGYSGPAVTVPLRVTALTESVVASTVTPLTEATLDGSVVTLTLNGATYASSIVTIRNAVAVSGITGVTVATSDVSRVNDTKVTVELTFNGTDFDTNATLTLTVGAGAIAGYSGPALTASLRVTALTESVVASTVTPLTEATLDGSVVTLTLTGATYASSIVTIRNAVAVSGITGVTVAAGGVIRVSDTVITVPLAFDGTNLAPNATLTLTVGAGAIAGYSGPAVTASLRVTALTESVVASTVTPLTEAILDGSVVTLTLNGATYASSIVTIRNAVAVSGIAGVTVATSDVSRVNDTKVTVELTFNGTDFDTNATLTLTVGAGAIAGYSGVAVTASLRVTALTESVVASTVTPLTEATLDGSVVTLTLNGATYEPSIVTIRNAVAVSGITGVTIATGGISRVNDTVITVPLAFDGTPLAPNATLTFTIAAGAIAGYRGPALTAPVSVTTGPVETTLMAIKGTITNQDGTPAGAGLQVTVTIGTTIKTAVSEADGTYSVFFFNFQGVAATSGDTVTVSVSNPTGASTEDTIQLSAAQIIAKQAAIDLQFSTPTQAVSVTASTVAPLTESTLNGSVVTLTLTGATYESSIVTIRNALTVSGITGVTVATSGVSRVSDTVITVPLAFDGTNLAPNATLTFTIAAGAIAGYSGPAVTASLRVTALTESVVASTATPLTEATLDGSVVTLTLTGATYESSIVTIRNAVAVSGITGVTVAPSGVSRVNDTKVTVELTFNGTDFDTNATLTLTVGAGAIAGYSGVAVTASLRVTALTESVVASTATPLTESTLDGSVVTLTLTGATYESSIVTIRNALTVSGITGVTIATGGVIRVSDTVITVPLAFDGTPLAPNATLTFTVAAGAIAGYRGPAVTAPLRVTALTESVVASTATPLTEATLDGSVVTLTLNGATYESSIVNIRNAVAVSGITGVTVATSDVSRVNDTVITVPLAFDGTPLAPNATLTFTIAAGAIAGYRGPALTAPVSVTTGPVETTLMAIKGTITNQDGTPAGAGLQVTVTIGTTIKTAVSEADGTYSVFFFNFQGVAATSGDTVTVSVSNPTGASTEDTIQLSAAQIIAKQAAIDLQFPLLDGAVSTPVSVRTPQVRDAIVAAVPGVNSANAVTAVHLAAIHTLSLSSQSITTLKAGDFDGFTALATLTLNNNALSTLPAGIFDELTALTTLALNNTNLSTLPSGIFDKLTALTRLDLNNTNLSTLPTGIFDELTALTTLTLNNTNLSTLPAGLFDGLTALTNLTLHGNAVDPLPLTVSLERVRSNQFKAVAPTGAPFEIVLPLIVANGTINGGATTITIPKGRVESALLTVTRTPGSTFGVTANIGAPLPARPVSHTGYTLVKSDELPLGFPALGGAVFTPVSERTAQVRDAIVDAVPGINSANDVTAVHVAAIQTLSLASRSITTLKAGDFDGFTALTRLDLNHNALSTLPAGIFDNLTALTRLDLNNTNLSTLRAGVFDNLTALTRLDLNNTALSTLPSGIFDELTALTTLTLNNTNLSTLPSGIFDNLTALTTLALNNTALSTLPAGSFDNLIALRDLRLHRNNLSTLPSGLFDGLTALTNLTLNGNAVDPLPLTVSLEQVEVNQFKAVAPTGAPFEIVLLLIVANGTIDGGATTITIPKGSVESAPLTVTRAVGTTDAMSVDIGAPLPARPASHTGYTLVKSDDLPLTFITFAETSLMAIKGTITNEDGSVAGAGLQVTVTIGSSTQTVDSKADGTYTVIFANFLGVVATSEDTVTVEVVSDTTGASVEQTSPLSPEQIVAKQATIDLQFTPTPSTTDRKYLLSVPKGISLIHVPLKVTAVDGVAQTIESVGDLYDALGGAATVSLLITYDPETGRWISYLHDGYRGRPGDKTLTDDLGIVASMKVAKSVLLSGDALGTNGRSSITLHPGINLVGVPLKDSRITRVSDLFKLNGIVGNVSVIIVSDNGFKVVAQSDDPGDIPVTGGGAFILTARNAATVEIIGTKWFTLPGQTAAPSTALTGLQTDGVTPILAVTGSISRADGKFSVSGKSLSPLFRVTVKNLSTGRVDTAMTDEDGGSYQFTFVDLETGSAARVGDILEITAHSPDPFVGVHPVRHTVTADDVERSWISLGALVAYEIPAKTELLLNYPNPFNPETWIPYRLAKDAFVTVTIYDQRGRVVRDIAVGHRIAAVYESRSKAIYWDGRTEFGERVASGIYFYTLIAGDYSATRKMVILK